jgi:MoaA/NifB/PqqE/SkfB family radical SAM enzyme
MSFLKSSKVLYHPEKIQEWMTSGDTSAPITVKIDLTNVCNHNCPGCIDHDLIANDNNELPLTLLKELLDDMKKIGVKGVNYTGGGEPTAHKEFAEIIRYTAKLGFDIGLICNGSLFHKQSIPMDELLKEFTWIRVSLDAYDHDTHIRTHGSKATFDQTITNMRDLVRIKTEQKLDVTLGAGYITNQYEDMDRQCWRFVELCKDIGVDYVQLRPSFGFFFDYKKITPDEWRGIFKDLKKYQDDSFSVIIDEDKFEKILAQNTDRCYTTCHAQSFKSTSITAVGGVYVCCSLSGRPEGFVGNIKAQKFSEIWNGARRANLLKALDVGLCPKLCVGDNLNEFLEKVKTSRPAHINFL